MRCYLALLLLVGAAVAEYDYAWQMGNEYRYLVRSRTLVGLNNENGHFNGILLKGVLTVQAKSLNMLMANMSNMQYARLQGPQPRVMDVEIEDRSLQYMDLPMSHNSFQIRLKEGIIQDMVVDQYVPIWEVNLLKSIVSQLQVNAAGSNALKSKSSLIPKREDMYGSFEAIENSITGNCKVSYDMMPLPEKDRQENPELIANLSNEEDRYLNIIKSKDHNDCEQHTSYNLAFTGEANWVPDFLEDGKFLSRSSVSRVVISGDVSNFLIRSSVTTEKIFIKLRLQDRNSGVSYSRMNLTLAAVDNAISRSLPPVAHPLPTRNLQYAYNRGLAALPQALPEERADLADPSEEMPRDHLRRSALSNSKERNSQQSELIVEQSIDSLLIPFYPANLDINSGLANKKNLQIDVMELIYQIAKEMGSPRDVQSHNTLQKFVELSRLIRVFKMREILDLANNLPDAPSPKSRLNSVKENAIDNNKWIVLRDAVLHAGTVPALKAISYWIDEKRFGDVEAAVVLSRIPKNALLPTEEYLQVFYELINNNKVISRPYVNVSAPLAFAELLRYYIIANSYDHHEFRVPGHRRIILSPSVNVQYISVLESRFRQAVSDKDSSRIQTYIIALGNVGHPKILVSFEPYLNNVRSLSNFQRTIMVASLSKLTETSPKLARDFLFNIYMNLLEDYEVRSMAVFLLMKTDPPLNILQRMAEFTNYDTSKHVNSVVKTALDSLANLKGAKWRRLSMKARIAQKLVKPGDNKIYSKSYITDSVIPIKNFLYKFILNIIGSEDSPMPKSAYLGLDVAYDSIIPSSIEMGYMLSSVKELLNVWKRLQKEPQDKMSLVDKIVSMVNIQKDNRTQLEGNIFLDMNYDRLFYPIDNDAIRSFSQLYKDYILSDSNVNSQIDIKSLSNQEMMMSFPTESGLPLFYLLDKSKLLLVKNDLQIKKRPSANIANPWNIKVENELRLQYSDIVHGVLSIVTPFENKQYAAAIYNAMQFTIPMRLELEMEPFNMNLRQFVIYPLAVPPDTPLVSYHVFPYIALQDVNDYRSVILGKERQLMKQKKSEALNLLINNDMLRIMAEGDNLNYLGQSEKPSFKDYLKIMAIPFDYYNDRYTKLEISSNSNLNADNKVKFTMAYDIMEIDDQERDDQELSLLEFKNHIMNSELFSEERRAQLMKILGKDINSAAVRVLDVGLDMPQYRHALVVGAASSNVDEKSRVLAYWNMQSSKDENIHLEACAGGKMLFSRYIPLDFERMLQSKQKHQFDGELRFGKSCENGESVILKGVRAQSEDMKKLIADSEIAKECRNELKKDKKWLPKCQKASALAALKDQMEISMDFKSNSVRSAINNAVQFVRQNIASDVFMEVLNPKNIGKKIIDIKAKMSPDFEKAIVSVHTPDMDVSFSPINFYRMGLPMQEKESNMLPKIGNEPACTLDGDNLVTFDERYYSISLGNCWHVMMITIPQANPDNPKYENLPTPIDMGVAILTREIADGSKDMKIILGNREIRMRKSDKRTDSVTTEVTVDKQRISFSNDESYQHKEGNVTVFEIFKLEDRSIQFISEKYKISVRYSEKRIHIQVSDNYRGTVRGLCGNFDTQPENDFVIPTNCILKKPEEFSAMYALIEENCEGPAPGNKQLAKQSKCVPLMIRQSRAFRDMGMKTLLVDSNKRWDSCTSYRTKIIEEDDRICFSHRPLPTCLPTCRATEMKRKKYDFYCMPKNDLAMQFKEMIENGANPDFTNKPVSMRREFDVPIACRAQ